MRLLVLISILVSSTLLANTNWFMLFDYNEPVPSNAVTRIYYTTNISLPVTNWTLVSTNTLTQGTNKSPEKLPFSRTQPNFFIISVSNEWGEVFSDVLGSWPLTGDGIKLRLSN